MDQQVQNIWTNNFVSALGALTSLSRWLILLNLSITLNYITEYLQWTQQKELLSRYETAVHQPWQPLQSFYEESMDSLAVYEQEVAEPLIKLSYSGARHDNVAGHDSVSDSVVYVRKNLSAYGANLTNISTAQENGTPFDELDKQQLTSLIGLIRFSDTSQMDSLRQRLPSVAALAGASGAGPVADFKDFIGKSKLGERDYRTFVRENLPDSTDTVQHFLQAHDDFQSLNTVNANISQARGKIKDFESGASIGIPLTSVNVSLKQFVIVAGVINLGIIFYFTGLFRRTRILWAKYAAGPEGAADGVSAAYFFNWTWGIRRMALFVPTFSVFMAWISVISLVFAFLLYGISAEQKFPPGDLWVIGFFAAVNVGVAVWVGMRYYRFGRR